jgi:outer membrane protein
MSSPSRAFDSSSLGLALCLAVIPSASALGLWSQTDERLPAPPGSAVQTPGDASNPRRLELSLDKAFQIAISNNLNLALGSLDEEVARLNALGSWGAFDPVLDISANYSDAEIPQANPFITGGVSVLDLKNESLSADLTLPTTSGGSFRAGFDGSITETNNAFAIANEFTDGAVGLGYTQPLMRGFGKAFATAEQKSARLTWLSARERQRQTLEQLLGDVANAYWDLVAAQEEVKVRVLSVELGKTQLDQNRERARVGVGTEVDVLQAETRVSTEEEALLLARTNVAARMDALKALLYRRGEEGQERFVDYLGLWELDIVTLTPLPDNLAGADDNRWQVALARALEHRPDLNLARLQVQTSEVDLALRRSQKKPGLDLNLDFRSNSNDVSTSDSLGDAFGYTYPTYAAALVFNLPLGNRRAAFAERAARATLIRSRLAYEQAENAAIADVRNASRELAYRAQAVVAARKSRQFSQRQLDASAIARACPPPSRCWSSSSNFRRPCPTKPRHWPDTPKPRRSSYAPRASFPPAPDTWLHNL